jgi:hypothetical protein
MTTEHQFKVGDWVTITGRVHELHPNDVDLGVEVFSKTDQYTAFVRRDLCAPTARPVEPEPDKGSVVMADGVAHQRAQDDGSVWYEVGCEVPRTWDELNQLDEPVVIHHA